MNTLLEVKDLVIKFEKMDVPVVNGVSFTLPNGKILGVVGESGCGKSTLAKTVLGVLPSCGSILGGELRFQNLDLVNLPKDQRKSILSHRLGVITQESLSSLNPERKIAFQFEQLLGESLEVTKQKAKELVKYYLKRVGCSNRCSL